MRSPGARARIAVAFDRSEIHAAGRAFAADLAWALAFPGATTMRAQPAIVGSTLFLSVGENAKLFALDIAGEINPPPGRGGEVRAIESGVGQRFARGAELGRFNMGSTVVLLFPPGRIEWQPGLVAGRRVRMGEPLLRLPSP